MASFDLLPWLLLLFPLLGVIVNGFFGARLGRSVVRWVGPGVVLLSFLTALISLLDLFRSPDQFELYSHLFTWIAVGEFQVKASLLLDPLSLVMVLVVTGVGFLIHVYSTSYMAEDERLARFFTLLNLFIFSMLTLVLAGNFLLLFVGWELVGFCSYMLIGFWFERPSAADAGKKAFIVNRVGDFGFALGVFLIFATFGSLAFTDVLNVEAVEAVAPGTITTITLLLFVGAVGKSAQIPLYVWLPDAMEGPTPVSALIHAATMVTAGVYMVARTNVLFGASETTSSVVAWIGVLTAFFAATIALVQTDLKRILAYSTVSQLGYMMLGVGVGGYAAGIFHLTTHAFFKALLFLGAGSVMHALAGELDIFKMGGLREKMPTTYRTFLWGAVALAGFPLLSGFFSKDEILWLAANESWLLWGLGIVTAFLTALYAFRMVFVVFLGQPRDKKLFGHAHESSRAMTVPLVILAVLAVIGGLLNLPGELIGAERLGLMNNLLEHTLEHHDIHLGRGLQWGLLGISGLLPLIALLLVQSLWGIHPDRSRQLSQRYAWLHNLLVNKYYVDEFYIAVIVNPLRRLGAFLAEAVERQVIDRAVNGVSPLLRQLGVFLSDAVEWQVIDRAVNGVALLLGQGSKGTRRLQTGYIRNYALGVVLGVVVICA
ncbi:MAG: NADH-quinone oxidoreductase subunit L, partial [Anaerolineae bacterium]